MLLIQYIFKNEKGKCSKTIPGLPTDPPPLPGTGEPPWIILSEKTLPGRCIDLSFFQVPQARCSRSCKRSPCPIMHSHIVRAAVSVFPQTLMRKDREQRRREPLSFFLPKAWRYWVREPQPSCGPSEAMNGEQTIPHQDSGA